MQVSRPVVVTLLLACVAGVVVTGACAPEARRHAEPREAVRATVARPPVATASPTAPATAPSSRPTSRPDSTPTTKPSTRPTTGPTEKSAAGVVAPPAPALSPEQALKTFTLAPGFRVELIAAEPLIQDPVVIAFDADGRVWAAEMTSYMPDAWGHGEDKPDGKIVILEDTDGDGRLDKRSVWLDGLVLPRALLPLRDGALVGAPPNLWFWRDTDGDGKADKQTLVATDFGNPRQNPEHQANGLLLALDNWVYTVNYDKRFRWVPDDEAIDKGDKRAVKWISSRIPTRGQWGQSMDDQGRLYHNSNSDYLRADLVPPHYHAGRNPHYSGREGVNVQLDKDQSVWPIRPTPAVNRGYRPGFLRPDGTLKEFTAACAPCVYRGGLFPKDCDGDVFVCEPSAHLIRRAKIEPDGVQLRGRNAYDKNEPPKEFLASTDERFRPVNLNIGPDGVLYVVDLYRGILQHNYYLTGYLRDLALRRGMEQPVHTGRIYRIVHASQRPPRVKKLSPMATAELVAQLDDPNGWVRDTAQRLIVERNDRSVAPALRAVLKRTTSPNWPSVLAEGKGRVDPRPLVHALWALNGLSALDRDSLIAALHGHTRVIEHAVRLSEQLLAGQPKDGPPAELLATLLRIAKETPDPRVRLQCAFTLSAVDHPAATEAVAILLAAARDDKLLRDAALSGLAGRESDVLETLFGYADMAQRTPGGEALLAALASCVMAEGKPLPVSTLLLRAGDPPDAGQWRQTAILSGMATAVKKRGGRRKRVLFDFEPKVFTALLQSKDDRVRELAKLIDPALQWPGKAEEKQAVATPLTTDQQKLFNEGKALFGATCAACHQPSGEGLEGKAPPLLDSPWLLGPDARVIRIVLNGVKGPIHIRDEVIDMEMPSVGVLDDRQIAAILTYARREWGHTGDPVEPETVAKVRRQTQGRPDAWTEEELLKVK